MLCLHGLPFLIIFICHNRLGGEYPFHHVCCIHWHEVVSVLRHPVHIDTHHAAVIRNAAAGGDIEAGFFQDFHLVHHRAVGAVLFRLVEGLGKGFLGIAVVSLKPGFQGVIEKHIVFGVIVSGNLPILVQLQLRQSLFGQSIPRLPAAADGLGMGGAGDLPAGHLGHENRSDFLPVIVVGQVEFPNPGIRVGREPGQKLLPETVIGLRKFRGIFFVKVCLGKKLPSLRVHILAYNLLPQLPALRIAGNFLNHAGGGHRHHRRIHGVVQIPILPVLGKSQHPSHMTGDCAVYRPDRGLGGRGGKL